MRRLAIKWLGLHMKGYVLAPRTAEGKRSEKQAGHM